MYTILPIQANDMLLHGKPITALEAKTAGLVSEVFHHDSLEQNVLPLAKHLTTKSLEVIIVCHADTLGLKFPTRLRNSHLRSRSTLKPAGTLA